MRGMASSKTRRRRGSNELVETLEFSPYIKIAIFAGFVAGLALLTFGGQLPEPTTNFVVGHTDGGPSDNAIW